VIPPQSNGFDQLPLANSKTRLRGSIHPNEATVEVRLCPDPQAPILMLMSLWQILCRMERWLFVEHGRAAPHDFCGCDNDPD
jgi:hypothetical protein